MSMVTTRMVHESQAPYCVDTESSSNSQSGPDSFKGFADRARAKNRSPNKSVTVVTVNLDNTIDIEDSESSESELRLNRKRRRVSSSSEEDFQPRSRSPSPEISYGGAPVIYKLREQEGRVFIIKVPMTSKQEKRRSQKVTDNDISILLDSDDEDLTIFDPVQKTDGQVVKALQNGDKHPDSPKTPKRPKKPLDTAKSEQNSPKGTPSRSKTLRNEEVSLKLKLRRSTEQSNYKIAVDHDEEKTRRSTRISLGTPKKCGFGDCDEDHSVHKKTPKRNKASKESVASTATPRRTRRNSKTVDHNGDALEMKNIHNKENESEDNNMDEDTESISSQRRSTRAKSRSATPQMEGKKVADTGRGTPRKDGKKSKEPSTPRRGYLETAHIIEDFDSNEDSNDSHERITRKREFGTPQKIRKADEVPSTPSSTRPRRNSRAVYYNYDLQDDLRDNEAVAPSTPSSTRPRRNSRSVYYNYELQDELRDNEEVDNDEEVVETRGRTTRRPAVTADGTATPQKQRKVLEEVMTPKRTPRRSVLQKLDEPETPKRTPRKSALRKLAEPATPKQTPRKTAAEKLDEPVTPKRTPRKSSLQKVEEAATPKQTPRKPSLQKVEEAATPKQTPRKSAVQKIEEMSTPKRTPRKPATILEDDEPMTPTMRKRALKATTPSVKHGNLTPSMSRRTANVGRPKTILEEARHQLHVSTVPKSLPCRDDEFNDIFRFLESKLLDKSSGCIYISGVPGTGKTATVTEAIRALKRCVAKGELDNFDFIEINGMKLSEPRQAYVQILKQITGETPTWEQAHGILDKLFKKSNAKRPMTLLLVDELDLLCNKRQDVVYNLLDWPATRNAHLVVITIANTMDLPERILMSRVTSRLGLTRLTFQPYTFKQLQEIVTARLKDSDAFRSEAIQLVARKVAAVSGDARRALDICRRATEITEFKNEKVVTMPHVNEALQEMISSAKVKAIKLCSEMEKYFLRAVDSEVTRTGVEEVVFQDIYRQLMTICAFEGIKTPNVTQALGICSRLSAYRLLLCEQTRNDSQRRIILNVSSDDIHFAMNVS